MKTKAILYKNSWNFALGSAIIFWVRIVLKKFAQVLWYVVFTQVRRHVRKQITKKKIRQRKARTFCFRKTSFFHSRSETNYALFLGYFGLKFLPDIRHCVYWVLVEIWAPISSHKIWNNFFIHHCQGRKEDVKLFDFFPRLILIRLTRNLSCLVRNSVEILKWNFKKKLFRDNFQKFYWNQRLSCTETRQILPYFLQFYSWSRLCWNNLHKYFHMLFSPR